MCGSQELVQFGNGVMGIAFNLEARQVGVIIMGDYSGIEEGMEVRGTGRIASVPVGDALIGRVVNALGQPIDGKGPIAIRPTSARSSASPPAWSSARTLTRRCRPASRPSTP